MRTGLVIGMLSVLTSLLILLSAVCQFGVITRWPTVILYVILWLLIRRSPARRALLWFAVLPTVLYLVWGAYWLTGHALM